MTPFSFALLVGLLYIFVKMYNADTAALCTTPFEPAAPLIPRTALMA
jgi:hypothetical protein